MKKGFAELKGTITQIEKENAQGFAELRESQKRDSAELKETIAKLEEENARGFAELRKSHKELNKKWGELSRCLGTIVEDLVAPSLERIFLKVTNLPNG